jgi:hypothetical protein
MPVPPNYLIYRLESNHNDKHITIRSKYDAAEGLFLRALTDKNLQENGPTFPLFWTLKHKICIIKG